MFRFAKVIVATLVLAVSGLPFPVSMVSEASASGGAIVTVLFDEATANGRLRVVSRYFEASDRTLVTGTFFAPNGDVVSVGCDTATNECVGTWPSGASIVTRPLANGSASVEVYSGSTLLWAGTVDSSGNFAQGSAESFRGWMAALGQDNASSLAYFTGFLQEQQILEPDGFQCFALGDRTKRNVSCATAIIGFIGSYAPLFTCATIVTCPIAVGLHAAAVAGMFTSCF